MLPTDPALLINILAPETRPMTTETNPALAILETIATQDRAAAMVEVDALISTLTSIRSDLADPDKNLSWWAEAFDARKAQSSIVRVVATQSNQSKAAAAVAFANR